MLKNCQAMGEMTVKTAEYSYNVKPEWRAAFARFVETGDAEEDFLNYLNSDEEAQQAVETAFNAQAEAFQNMADEFKKNETPRDVQNEDSLPDCPSGLLVEGEVEEAVEGILLLSPTQRSELVHRTASALKASLRPDQQELLVKTVKTLTRAATTVHE